MLGLLPNVMDVEVVVENTNMYSYCARFLGIGFSTIYSKYKMQQTMYNMEIDFCGWFDFDQYHRPQSSREGVNCQHIYTNSTRYLHGASTDGGSIYVCLNHAL
jgi:hypothetical protein